MIVELVCCSAEDCLLAETAGANRIELTGALEVGGLTPSYGMMEVARRLVSIPIYAMNRPRGGGFDYTEYEFETMLSDTNQMVNCKMDGMVFGVLTSDGEIDLARSGKLVQAAGSMLKIHHRAIDVCRDSFVALEKLIDLGFDRILTSGRENGSLEGADLLKRLHEKADGRIEIMPGGGITPENAQAVVDATGIQVVHLALFESLAETSCQNNPSISFSGLNVPPDGKRVRLDKTSINQMVNSLNTLYKTHQE